MRYGCPSERVEKKLSEYLKIHLGRLLGYIFDPPCFEKFGSDQEKDKSMKKGMFFTLKGLKRSGFCENRSLIWVWFWKIRVWPGKGQINNKRPDVYSEMSEKGLIFVKKVVWFGSDFEKNWVWPGKGQINNKRSDFHSKKSEKGLIFIKKGV